jgi:chemotaxis protein methyltransferase CheR
MSAQPHATHDDFIQFCTGVRRLTGIDLTQYKRRQMERRVRTFADRRAADLAGYLQVLSGSRDELNEFLDRVTINVSQLWRNPEQWETLAKIVAGLAETGTVRAWSAGCSYGAEAYTLAAIGRDVAPRARLEIIGTDIDKRMVARAREGLFTIDDARSAPAAQLKKWFDREPDGWRAKPELRLLTRFDTGDLLNDRVQAARFDLVLCRNVVIYFTEPVRDALHHRLVESLRTGGYLMVGSSERVADPRGMGLESPAPFIYRKAA